MCSIKICFSARLLAMAPETGNTKNITFHLLKTHFNMKPRRPRAPQNEIRLIPKHIHFLSSGGLDKALDH